MRPVTAIGRWSTRRPWRAIAAWLAFVVAALVAMSVTGTKSLQNGAVGESARGYALMNEHQAWGPTREYGYLHSDTLRAQDPAFRAATADVAARVSKALENRVDIRLSRDRRSALVVGQRTHWPVSTDEL